MEQADEAARVIASLSPEWNKRWDYGSLVSISINRFRFMTEKFRYYNAQWLEMVEKEGGEGEEEELTFDDRYVYYDDNYIDYDDESSSQLF